MVGCVSERMGEVRKRERGGHMGVGMFLLGYEDGRVSMYLGM